MGQTRRTYLARTTGTLAGLAIAGCLGDGGPGAQTEAEADPDPDVEAADLLLNWKPNGLHAPYYAAVDQGFYEAEGIDDVTIESGQGSDFSAQQAGLGNVEFAISSSDQLLNVNSRGLSPRSVGVVMQRNPVVVFAPRERFDGLTDPAQLEGTTVGSGPGMVRQMTEAFLEHHDVAEDVDLVDSGFDTVQQLLSGEIDAAGGVFGDVVDAEHQGSEIDALAAQEAVPSYGHVVATSAGFADENSDAVRAFLRGTARGAVWATRNPEDAIDAILEANPELEEVRANQRDKWDLLHSEYALSSAVREHGWGWSEAGPWEATYETLAEADFFEDEIDPETVWTNEHLDTEYEYVGEYAERVEE